MQEIIKTIPIHRAGVNGCLLLKRMQATLGLGMDKLSTCY